ncbi:hypothetical protein FACS189431_3540 [Alphaproteobacteria bacterium]|nr:hypothetical protein FACS189431_3540 [Alphaproteobacteria bacterium]
MKYPEEDLVRCYSVGRLADRLANTEALYTRELIETRQQTLEYINADIQHYWDDSGKTYSVKQIRFSPENIKQVLSGGGNGNINRILNRIYYGDYIKFSMDQMGEGRGINCASYASFAYTFLQELVPECNPRLVFGRAHSETINPETGKPFDGNHFWVTADYDGEEYLLDNSGLGIEEIYENHQTHATASDWSELGPKWELDQPAIQKGGWLNHLLRGARPDLFEC